MERKLLNLVLLAALAEQSACSPLKPVHVEPSPTIAPPTQTAPAFTPSLENPTEILPIPTYAVEQRFIVGGVYDAAHTPIKIIADVNFRISLDHYLPFELTYTGDFPSLSTTGPYLNPKKYREFFLAEKDHSAGNPVNVIPVDLESDPNTPTRHIILDTHSRQVGVPGDLSKEIFIWFFRHVTQEKDEAKKEEAKQKLFSPVIPFVIGDVAYESHIVNATYFSEGYWEGTEKTSPWSQYPSEKVVYANSELLGIPKEIPENLKDGEILVTVIGCLPVFPFDTVEDKDNPDYAYYLNGRNRAAVTYKVSLDKPIK